MTALERRKAVLNKIAKAKVKKEQKHLFEGKNGNNCHHEWKKYKESIRIDWNVQSREYNGPISPYFIVYGCLKCKKRRYVDMKTS